MRLPQFFSAAFLLSFGAGIYLASCSSDPEPDNSLVGQFKGVLPALVQNDSNLFHGIALGMNKEEVKKFVLKTDSLAVEDQEYLQYEGRLGPGQEYIYDCLFDDKGLRDLTIDIFLKNDKNAHVLFTDFRNYFTKKYGPPTDSIMFWSWEVKSGSRPAIIDLIEEEDWGYGKLQIAMYDRDFEPDTASSSELDSLFLQ